LFIAGVVVARRRRGDEALETLAIERMGALPEDARLVGRERLMTG
jgi:hypothetical protein